MIEIKNLTKTFGRTVAVNSLSLTIQSGITGLVGENGAGKSTLFRLISNVLYADQGEILIDGIPCSQKEAKEKVFFLADDPYAPGNMKIKDVLDYYGVFYSFNAERIGELVKKLSLPTDKKISSFSKGMKRQFFLSLALNIDVPYILLDEAFDGLDPLILSLIGKEMEEKAAQGKTIVASSHNLATLENITDRFIVLSKGRLSSEGESKDIGHSLVKYQAIFERPVTVGDFASYGIRVLSIKKVGSIVQLVLEDKDGLEDMIRDAFHPTLLEKVGLDAEEILKIQMEDAKKEGESHD